MVKQQAESLFSEADTPVSEADSKQMNMHIDKKMMSMQTTSLSSCPPSSACPAPVTWTSSVHLSQGLCSGSSSPEMLPPPPKISVQLDPCHHSDLGLNATSSRGTSLTTQLVTSTEYSFNSLHKTYNYVVSLLLIYLDFCLFSISPK